MVPGLEICGDFGVEHAEVLKSQLEEQQNVQEVENVQADIRNKQKWTLREALDTAIAGGKLSPKQLNNIARNQQARTEFEAATGIKLEGLSNKKAVQAIQEHIDGRSKNATNADIESQMRENIDSRIADSKAKAKAAPQIENGDNNFTIRRLVSIAHKLSMPLKILFGEKPILNQKPVSVSVTSEQSSYGCAHSNNVIAFPGSYCSEM